MFPSMVYSGLYQKKNPGSGVIINLMIWSSKSTFMNCILIMVTSLIHQRYFLFVIIMCTLLYGYSMCFIGQEMMAYEYKKGTERYKKYKKWVENSSSFSPLIVKHRFLLWAQELRARVPRIQDPSSVLSGRRWGEKEKEEQGVEKDLPCDCYSCLWR